MRETLFWKNYFFHCENVRNQYFQRRVSLPQSSAPSPVASPARSLSFSENNKGSDGRNIALVTDDSSLVPASLQDDDASYVIASAPTSMNTLTETISVEDLVVVGKDCEESRDKY